MEKIAVYYCSRADEEHARSKRQYAHTFCRPGAVCFARAAANLTPNQFWAILAHEVGHLLAGYEGSESDANRAANEFFGIKIRYQDSQNGAHLQTISSREAERVRRALT